LVKQIVFLKEIKKPWPNKFFPNDKQNLSSHSNVAAETIGNQVRDQESRIGFTDSRPLTSDGSRREVLTK